MNDERLLILVEQSIQYARMLEARLNLCNAGENLTHGFVSYYIREATKILKEKYNEAK